MALNSQLLTVQILTNYVQVLILCLSYFITTVKKTCKCQARVALGFAIRVCYHIYQDEDNALYWAAADYAFDIVYIFDTLVIRTRLQFLDEAGIFEKNRGKTIRNFIRNGTFKVDMASLLPLDLLYFATGTIHILRQQRD